tara:strand:+ start:8283 stop:8588 length:306 start_codon:yes stop_codon:yes gene_type:complete
VADNLFSEQTQEEPLEETACLFCKNPLNAGASTCASCGAFKYSVKKRLLPGLLISSIPILILPLFFGLAGLLFFALPIGVYLIAKQKHKEFKGWAPPRGQW